MALFPWRGLATRLTCAFGVLFAGGVSLAASEAGKDGDAYARLSGDVMAEALIVDQTLFADEAPAFRAPPWLAAGRVASGGEGGASASASWVLLNDELGAADRFAGTGSGLEVRLAFRRPSGWGTSIAISTVDRGVYSSVDDRPVSIERYLFGANCTPARPGRWRLSPGVGLAWNVFDVHGADPALDIEGAGGYAELRALGSLGRRSWLEASGRAIYWHGKDGLGGSGAELSLSLGIGLRLRF